MFIDLGQNAFQCVGYDYDCAVSTKRYDTLWAIKRATFIS